MTPKVEPWSEARAREILVAEGQGEGRLLPVLHALLSAFGCVPKAAVPVLADHFNISRAEVHGTISFYHDFRAEPAGRHLLKLCRAEACQSVGARAFHDEVLRDLGTYWHGTTADGAVTVEPAYCLGLCATGPAALLDDRPLVRLDAEGLRRRLAEVQP